MPWMAAPSWLTTERSASVENSSATDEAKELTSDTSNRGNSKNKQTLSDCSIRVTQGLLQISDCSIRVVKPDCLMICQKLFWHDHHTPKV